MEYRVCPECGCDEFTQDQPRLVRVTLKVAAHSGIPYPEETGEEVMDNERDAEITCDGCGWELASYEDAVAGCESCGTAPAVTDDTSNGPLCEACLAEHEGDYREMRGPLGGALL